MNPKTDVLYRSGVHADLGPDWDVLQVTHRSEDGGNMRITGSYMVARNASGEIRRKTDILFPRWEPVTDEDLSEFQEAFKVRDSLKPRGLEHLPKAAYPFVYMNQTLWRCPISPESVFKQVAIFGSCFCSPTPMERVQLRLIEGTLAAIFNDGEDLKWLDETLCWKDAEKKAEEWLDKARHEGFKEPAPQDASEFDRLVEKLRREE